MIEIIWSTAKTTGMKKKKKKKRRWNDEDMKSE
jgi:hypothetical protein